MNRRRFLLSAAASASAIPPLLPAADSAAGKPRFRFSVRWGLIDEPGLSVSDKFRLLRDLGWDGVQMDSQYAVPVREIAAARDATGLPVHGVANANHWSIRLSDPTAGLRAKALEELLEGLRYTKAVGGSTLILVPGAVRDPKNENKEQVWERSIAGIRQATPLAAELGVRIGIATARNRFLYQYGEGAPADQEPDEFIRFVDEVNSAWVGIAFNPGNCRKYSCSPYWIRAMGSRIIQCGAGDYRLAKDAADGKPEGICDIGEGSVDWEGTREALSDINYSGWITSETGGGGREQLANHLARMRKHLSEPGKGDSRPG